jgi:tRNA(Ile)-lysidine synthase TilS/MesJ
MEHDPAPRIDEGKTPPAGESPSRGRVVALLSGGLDSTLAVRQMLDQGFDVLALNFVSPFCTCSPRAGDGCHMASDVARQLGVEIRVLSKGPEFLRIIESPRFGHGKGVNPCIDCRIFMLRRAGEVMREISAVCVVTGEVLGQRPMSQHRRALDLIEKESGLKGKLLRPLSARHLPATDPEREGHVDREALLAIRGRSRKDQLAMAKEKGIDLFSCPAGGCLLTEAAIARRIEDLIRHRPGFGMVEARLSTFGRHFRLHDGMKVILGHNEKENDRLARVGVGYARAELAEGPGPLALICGQAEESDLEKVGGLLWFYAKKIETGPVTLKVETPDEEATEIQVRTRVSEEDLERWRL